MNAIHEAIRAAEQRAEKAEAEAAGLRELLKPFADQADFTGTYWEGAPDESVVLYYAATRKAVRVGDFRRARAALNGAP